MLIEWIVGYDESINIVENPLFQDLLLLLQESLQPKDIPHQSTVRCLISSTFLEHFKAIKNKLEISEGMISLTVDGWDDKRRHTGHVLAKALLMIRAITTDGAANMAAMLEDYEHLLQDHVEDPYLDQQSLAAALQQDPIAISHDIVNTIHMSQICHEEFLSIIELGNKKERNRLTNSEWTVLEHICNLLEAPYILQEQMSREHMLMLANSLPAYESLDKYRPLDTSNSTNDHYQSPQKTTKFKLFDDLWESDETISNSAPTLCLTIEEELNNYCQPASWPNPEKVDILQWWDMNSDQFPTLFRLALDILPVQASSVAAERAFSSAAETDTPK
ncbi:hypothetical protein Clacol_005842 [Clathrus columnatus]|uniref:HAT C-terminal dimerisation domain-containing protein n=1 Tax=Clathrus columnatus TaxID=1419009 RepID=A0AAV5ADC6_9AGAM|nr:hypothetical protein Clacol_005842 [Clathrus columnatus]